MTDRMRPIGELILIKRDPPPTETNGGIIIPAGSQVVVELERSAASGLTTVVGSAFAGVAEVQDLKGVSVLSKATP